MLHQVFKTGTKAAPRGSSSAVNYLLGDDREREGARILKGDENDTLAICKDAEQKGFAEVYQSGVLSFEESDIPEEQKYEIMDSFENCLYPDMDKSRYNVLWVEHKDKGRLELNYMIPSMDLETGKTLSAYNHKSDMHRVNAWSGIINHEYGLSDPNDPTKAKSFSISKDLKGDRLEVVQNISLAVQSRFLSGEITDRDGVKKYLEENNLPITRETKNGLSVKPENMTVVRLKGEIFKAEPNPLLVSAEHKAILEAANNPASKAKEYEQNKERYAALVERKKDRLAERNHLGAEAKQHVKEKKQSQAEPKPLKREEIEAKKPESFTRPEKPKGLTPEQREKIKNNFTQIAYNKEIIKERSEHIKNHEKGTQAQAKRIAYLEQKQQERKSTLDHRLNQWQERQNKQEQKDARYLGLGRFLTPKNEREALKAEQAKEKQAIEKERAAFERAQQRLDTEKDLTARGYSKDDIKAISDAKYALQRHTKPEQDYKNQSAAYIKANNERIEHAKLMRKNEGNPNRKAEFNNARFNLARTEKYMEKIDAGKEASMQTIRSDEYQINKAKLENTYDNAIRKAEINRSQAMIGQRINTDLKQENRTLYNEAERLKAQEVKPTPSETPKTPQAAVQEPKPVPSGILNNPEALKAWNALDVKNTNEQRAIANLEKTLDSPEAKKLLAMSERQKDAQAKIDHINAEHDKLLIKDPEHEKRVQEVAPVYKQKQNELAQLHRERDNIKGFFKGGAKREAEAAIASKQSEIERMEPEREKLNERTREIERNNTAVEQRRKEELKPAQREKFSSELETQNHKAQIKQAEDYKAKLDSLKAENSKTQKDLENLPEKPTEKEREAINEMRKNNQLEQPQKEQQAQKIEEPKPQQTQSQDRGMSM